MSLDIPSPPLGRYILWTELSLPARSAALQLGYSARKWNVPGRFSSLEMTSWSDLSDEQRTLAETAMGINDDWVWDCWIAHYEDYFWHELQDAGLAEFYETLGWSFNAWEGTEQTPASDDADWVELTPDEQWAARNLCFNPYLWDGVHLADIEMTPNPTMNPTPGPTYWPTPAPSTSSIPSMSLAPSTIATSVSPASSTAPTASLAPTAFLSLSVEPSATPTPSAGVYPSILPSLAPSASFGPSAYPTASLAPSENPSATPSESPSRSPSAVASPSPNNE